MVNFNLESAWNILKCCYKFTLILFITLCFSASLMASEDKGQPITVLPKHVYKMCEKGEIQSFRDGDVDFYEGNDRDRSDGYIHLSRADQVKTIAMKYYRGRYDFVLLKISVDMLDPNTLLWEKKKTGDVFPHLYDKITRTMVEEFIDVPKVSSFDFATLE